MPLSAPMSPRTPSANPRTSAASTCPPSPGGPWKRIRPPVSGRGSRAVTASPPPGPAEEKTVSRPRASSSSFTTSTNSSAVISGRSSNFWPARSGATRGTFGEKRAMKRISAKPTRMGASATAKTIMRSPGKRSIEPGGSRGTGRPLDPFLPPPASDRTEGALAAPTGLGENRPRTDRGTMVNPQMVMYEEEFNQIQNVVDRLVKDANAKVVFIVDKNGQLIAASGDVDNLDTTSLASLTAGNIAATGGMAKLLKENEFATQFHEGEQANIT